MKLMLFLGAIVVLVVGAVTVDPEVAVIKESPLERTGIDGYKFSYELSNGEIREEAGQLKNNALVIRGSYVTIDPITNEKQTVNFVADKNGFHPEGPHLPV